MINNLFIDVGSISLNKKGEELCGDNVEILKPTDDMTVVILADGLGSGVKANILSILTSKILSTMLINGISIYKCMDTISSVLPICKVRKIAYSTFTAIKITNNDFAEIIEYDNPQIIFLRDGKQYNLERNISKINEKTIYVSKIKLQLNDIIISVSDGAINAGIGNIYNFGWQRDNLIEYIEKEYNNDLSSKTIASIITTKCNDLYDNKPGDDTTACVLKVLERKSVNLLIGPAMNTLDDNKMMSLFFSKSGKHIICGGTTANIASRFLEKEIDCNIRIDRLDNEIPLISYIEGVDLVTEGIITINKTLFYLKDYLNKNEKYNYWINHDDGASLITRLLIQDATDINFYVGRAVNPAHQNPDLNIDFNIKMKLVEEVVSLLEKIGKKINVSYF